MAFLILAWFVVTIIYIVVRATKSLKLGKATAYGVWVLIMEVGPPSCLHAARFCYSKTMPIELLFSNNTVLLLAWTVRAC